MFGGHLSGLGVVILKCDGLILTTKTINSATEIITASEHVITISVAISLNRHKGKLA